MLNAVGQSLPSGLVNENASSGCRSLKTVAAIATIAATVAATATVATTVAATAARATTVTTTAAECAKAILAVLAILAILAVELASVEVTVGASHYDVGASWLNGVGSRGANYTSRSHGRDACVVS